MRNQLPCGNGFTLVELLVVIAIIALLAAMAFPAIQGTMAKGRDARCASNLKNLSAGVLAYCADNNGLFPNPRLAMADTNKENYWHRQISGYLAATNFDAFTGRSKMDNMFLCPSDPAPYEKKLSYGLNSELFRKRLPNATRTTAIMIADSSSFSLTPARTKTNHGPSVQFVRLDGSFGRVTNVGTAVTSPELWKISH
jgi:prepilin-type N-terminal cleavage/methylation domain-containing protein